MSKRLEVIERTLQAGSKDPFVWYARAMELRSLGRLEDAAQAFTEVAEKFPDYVPTYLMAAQVTRALGRVGEARTWCARGAEVAQRVGDQHARGELEAEAASLAEGA